jgi:hypothetical protein
VGVGVPAGWAGAAVCGGVVAVSWDADVSVGCGAVVAVGFGVGVAAVPQAANKTSNATRQPYNIALLLDSFIFICPLPNELRKLKLDSPTSS